LRERVQHHLTYAADRDNVQPLRCDDISRHRKPGGTDKDLIAQQSFVTLGPTRGDQVAVLRGVQEGDLVVTSGQLKLNNGTPLIVSKDAQPANDPDPSPQEQ